MAENQYSACTVTGTTILMNGSMPYPSEDPPSHFPSLDQNLMLQMSHFPFPRAEVARKWLISNIIF